MRKPICIIIACVMIVTMFSGCSVLQKLGLQKNDDELHPVSSIVMNSDEAKKLTDKIPLYLYFANADNSKLALEVRYISFNEAKKSTSYLAGIIVKELIKGPSSASGLKPIVPKTTTVRSTINIKSGVATVDLSKDFIEKHPGGKKAEELTLYSIVNSLTELKEIEKVKFTIDGKQRKEFKGSFQFDAPFPRNAALVGKPNALPGSDSKNDSKSTLKKDTTDKQDSSTQKADKSEKSEKSDNNTKKDSGKSDADKNISENGGKQSISDAEDNSEETYLDILE